MSARTLQTAAEQVAHAVSGRPEILAAYIFGSLATGKARPDSDVDVAILLDPDFVRKMPLKYRLDLISDLGHSLETFAVDVVLLHDAPPALAHNVVTKGKLVFERSRSARIAFQVGSLNRYMDMEPLHKVQLQYMKRRYIKDFTNG